MKDLEAEPRSTDRIHATAGGLATMVIAAIGVVFGDIGTSPLYTVKEMFNPQYGLTPDDSSVKEGLNRSRSRT